MSSQSQSSSSTADGRGTPKSATTVVDELLAPGRESSPSSRVELAFSTGSESQASEAAEPTTPLPAHQSWRSARVAAAQAWSHLQRAAAASPRALLQAAVGGSGSNGPVGSGSGSSSGGGSSSSSRSSGRNRGRQGDAVVAVAPLTTSAPASHTDSSDEVAGRVTHSPRSSNRQPRISLAGQVPGARASSAVPSPVRPKLPPHSALGRHEPLPLAPLRGDRSESSAGTDAPDPGASTVAGLDVREAYPPVRRPPGVSPAGGRKPVHPQPPLSLPLLAVAKEAKGAASHVCDTLHSEVRGDGSSCWSTASASSSLPGVTPGKQMLAGASEPGSNYEGCSSPHEITAAVEGLTLKEQRPNWDSQAQR